MGEYNREIRGSYSEAADILWDLNQQNHNIYFAVNSGGFKDCEITGINAVFIDLDCGKDENKQYFPLEIVDEYKKSKLEELNGFVNKPSYVIETRNGLHAYWLVENATVEQFTECQLRLITHFSADKACKNPARLMRTPGYYWCKDPKNKYWVDIIQRNDVRYNIKSLIDSLPDISGDGRQGYVQDKKDTLNRDNNIISVSIAGTQNLTPNIQHIKQRDIEVLQAIVKPEPALFNSHDEVYHHLKRQDLNAYLGLPHKFCCLFHDEANPSANIYVDPNTNFYWYKCFSESCGVTWDIISVTENLLKCSRIEALRFLRRVYKIGYHETSWQKEHREIFQENTNLLNEEKTLIQLAPETHKRIRNYLRQLVFINEYAQSHINTDKFTDSNGAPVFYGSTRFLADKCRKDEKQFRKVLALFAYLGLLNKLPDNEIPDFLLRDAKRQAAKRKQQYRVGFYSIPQYSENTLAFSEAKAMEFKERGFTMKGWGRELLLRTLGEKEADRVFPQSKGKEIPSFNDYISSQMELVAMREITSKGWTTE